MLVLLSPLISRVPTDRVTLPTNYTTFKWFTIVGVSSTGGKGSVTVPTAWLAAHTSVTTFNYPTDQNAPGRYAWAVGTRLIRGDNSTSIQYAELHD